VNQYERKTERLLASVQPKADGLDALRLEVARVFRQHWMSALPLRRIRAEAGNFSEADVRRVLAAMVRAKILRAYVTCGDRHWEVNY